MGERAYPVPVSMRGLFHTVLPDMNINKVQVVSSYKWRWGRMHWGIDVQGKGATPSAKGKGTRVCSPLEGRVADFPQGATWGAIMIYDSLGNVVVLGHMILTDEKGKRYVNPGDVVHFGQSVGRLSDCGSEGKYHLHFEAGRINPDGKTARHHNPEGRWNDMWWRTYHIQPHSDVPWDPNECKIGPARKRFKKKTRPNRRRDPLILDLQGDGIGTSNLKDGQYFDYDADGFAERMAWIDPRDGLLAMDLNGDGVINSGRELFGDQTILRNGKRAANGFEALSDLDANADGKIDEHDEAYSRLSVWTDLDGDEYASETEICNFADLGITSISLSATLHHNTDEQGNDRTRIGNFQWCDGTMGQIAEYLLPRDPAYTMVNDTTPVPDEMAEHPYLQGYGTVYDLDQAICEDSSGQLKSLVEQFICAGDPVSRNALMEQILFKWTGSEDVQPTSRGGNIDARKLTVLERFFGETWLGEGGPNPSPEDCIDLSESYRLLFELMYGQLMAITHLNHLYEKIEHTYDSETDEARVDLSGVITDIQQRLSTGHEDARQVLAEFARSLRGFPYELSQDDYLWQNDYLTLREVFVQQDPDLGWIFDTGGLPVYDQLGQSQDGWYFPHMFGTWGSEAVQGSATLGDGWINSLSGNDVVYGTDRNEHLLNQDGDSILVAGGGADIVWAGDGADILDGGSGSDVLYGESGDDTYIFRIGSGNDTIIDVDATEGNIDTIWLGSNLTSDDITLKRSVYDLVLSIGGTSDTLTVQGFFSPYLASSTLRRVEQIQFMDGTSWDETEIIARAYAPTDRPDTICGGPGEDELSGLGGNDVIVGLASNDTLYGDEDNDALYGSGGLDYLAGGSGADRLYGEDDADILIGGLDDDYTAGGPGNDVYRFNRGDGHDTIDDTDTTAGNTDTLELGADILPTDVQIQRMGKDLKLTILDTGDSVTVKDWLVNDTPVHGIELVTFTVGTVWDTATIQDMLVKGTDAADTIIGFSGADTIEGYGSNDTIYARGGDDFVDSGSGNDVVYAEQGNDTAFAGDGNDTVVGGFGNDFLDPGSGEDRLYGGERPGWGGPIPSNGNDTYFFSIGYGNDIILDHDRTAGNIDTIKLGDGIAPGDIRLTQTGEDLTLSIKDTTDILTVQNWFWNDSPEYRVEQIEFSDGTVWDVAAVKQQVIQGTPGDDFCIGYITSDTISAYEGNDRLYGRQGDDTLLAGPGDDDIWAGIGADVLSGGPGEDTLVAGDGDDSCDPGEGRDVMYGGSMHEAHELYFTADRSNGNDTYRFGTGYGQDTIIDRDSTSGNLDTIVLNADILVADVNVRHVDDDLVRAVVVTGDTLTVHNWFLDDSTEWQTERIQFADGTIWDVDSIKQMALQGTPGDDLLIGYASADTLAGYAGKDRLFGLDGADLLLGGDHADELYGGPGQDLLDGGADADLLMGGLGDDAYLFGLGSGSDTIMEDDSTPGNIDAVVLDAGIAAADVGLKRELDDLVISINGTTDTLTIQDWFRDDSAGRQVEEIRFGDGTVWDVATVEQMMLQGTPEDDLLRGYASADTIVGYAGSDRLSGYAGGDFLDPGSDDDYADGGFGSDTYVFDRGYGHDVITDVDTTAGNLDTILLGPDVLPGNVSLKAGGHDLFLSIDGSDDTLQVKDWFAGDAFKIEQVLFADGTVWDVAMMQQIAATPTDTDDYLVGTADKDLMDGGAGDDVLFGRENSDTLFGGPGEDEIYGLAANNEIGLSFSAMLGEPWQATPVQAAA
ncbi:MAG: calcium-binding protein [Pseudomonadota bacterium]